MVNKKGGAQIPDSAMGLFPSPLIQDFLYARKKEISLLFKPLVV